MTPGLPLGLTPGLPLALAPGLPFALVASPKLRLRQVAPLGVGKNQLGEGAQKVQGFCGQVPTRGEMPSGRRGVVEHQELLII